MKQTNRRLMLYPAAVVLCLCLGFTAWAASPVGDVSLNISSSIRAGDSGGEVDVHKSSSNSRYEVGSVSVRREPDDGWSIGDEPEVEISLEAEPGYYFDSTSKSDYSVTGDGNRVTSVSRNSDRDQVVLFVRLYELGHYGDSSTDGLSWDGDSGTAEWSELNWADKYQVRLYRDGDSIGSIVTTEDNSYDFGSRLTKRGYYSFEVRGVDEDGEKGEWSESGDWYVSSSMADDFEDDYGDYDDGAPGNSNSASGGPGASNNSGWIQDQSGWWFRNTDGSYARNDWQLIHDKWYYFNGSGYMATGWIWWKNKCYYCDTSGAMVSNTVTPDGYRVGADGAWIP